MMIKLPKNITVEFKAIKSNLTEESPRTVLNHIMVSGPSALPNLYKYLFNSKGYQKNQLKFLIALYSIDYLFEEERFKYLTEDGKSVIYIPDRKIFVTGESIFRMTKVYGISQTFFTRDEILDSPLDINKLKEVPINEANSNDSNN